MATPSASNSSASQSSSSNTAGASGAGAKPSGSAPTGKGPSFNQQSSSTPKPPQSRASAPKTPYEILGVKPGATKAQIESKFRKEALNCHPDKFASASQAEKAAAEAQFKVLNNAKDALLKGEKTSKAPQAKEPTATKASAPQRQAKNDTFKPQSQAEAPRKKTSSSAVVPFNPNKFTAQTPTSQASSSPTYSQPQRQSSTRTYSDPTHGLSKTDKAIYKVMSEEITRCKNDPLRKIDLKEKQQKFLHAARDKTSPKAEQNKTTAINNFTKALPQQRQASFKQKIQSIQNPKQSNPQRFSPK